MMRFTEWDSALRFDSVRAKFAVWARDIRIIANKGWLPADNQGHGQSEDHHELAHDCVKSWVAFFTQSFADDTRQDQPCQAISLLFFVIEKRLDILSAPYEDTGDSAQYLIADKVLGDIMVRQVLRLSFPASQGVYQDFTEDV
jgi:hypothetical protein